MATALLDLVDVVVDGVAFELKVLGDLLLGNVEDLHLFGELCVDLFLL